MPDAGFVGLGVVLMRKGHSIVIAFVSKALAKRHLSLSVYEKRTYVHCSCSEKVVPLLDCPTLYNKKHFTKV